MSSSAIPPHRFEKNGRKGRADRKKLRVVGKADMSRLFGCMSIGPIAETTILILREQENCAKLLIHGAAAADRPVEWAQLSGSAGLQRIYSISADCRPIEDGDDAHDALRCGARCNIRWNCEPRARRVVSVIRAESSLTFERTSNQCQEHIGSTRDQWCQILPQRMRKKQLLVAKCVDAPPTE